MARTRPAPRGSAAQMAALVVVGAALVVRVLLTRSWPFWDLDVYVAGGRALLDHADLYAVEAHGLVFTYPPFAALLFTPFVALGEVAGAGMTAVSLLGYLVTVTTLAHRVGLGRTATMVVGLGGLALEPVARTLVLGQVNLVLMALVVVDLFLVPRRARGLLVGLAIAVKLTPAVFLVYLVLQKDWRSLARAVLAFAGASAVGWLVAPAESSAYWFSRVFSTGGFGDYQIQSANQSIRGVLIRLLGTPDPPSALWPAIVLVVVAVGVWGARSRILAGDDIGAVLVLAAAGLLASPISWTHHWVWAAPAVVYLVARRHWAAAWGTGTLFFIAPMWFLPSGGGTELGYAPWQVAVSAAYVLAGLLAVACAALAPRRTQRPSGG